MRERIIDIIQKSVDGCSEYWAGLIADGILENSIIPQCKIGDTAYGIRRFHSVPKIQEGKISEMYYLLPDMSLQIVIKYVCRGKIGESIFLTREDAEKALKEREENA